MAQLTQATPRNYWISPNALFIQLNAMGTPDYIQASCTSGAQILVYVKDIIPYDAGHNYQRWPLQASPTVFNSHTEKYVYVAVPRSDSSQKEAVVVFPSEEIDIYGKNEKEEQIGDEKYYYIFLQGIITSSGDNGTTPRDWKENCRIATGYLSSDEAISVGPDDSEWFSFSPVDNFTTFLKDLTMKAGTKFRELFAKAVTIVSGGSITFEGQHTSLSGVADETTAAEAVDRIVTPKYMDDHALSSVHDDVANGLITFLQGLQVGSSFVSGLLGTGGVFRKDADGKTYIEVDKIYARVKAIFDNVEIRNFQHTSGNRIVSVAGMTIVRVENVDANGNVIGDNDNTGAITTAYRCYFRGKDGDNLRTNDFVVGDLAFCSKTNVDENLTHKRYWRAVVRKSNEVDINGNHWIDLSVDDCEKDSDIPSVGDDVSQLGNKTKIERQGVIIEMSSGEEAPCYQIFQGINDYTLDKKCMIDLGYNSTTGRAKMNVYGDTYIGDIDGNSFLRYDSLGKTLEIKAKIDAKSTIGDRDIDAYIRDNTLSSDDVKNLINNSEIIGSLQNQIDGAIETWYYEGKPTLENLPAQGWTDDDTKNKHIGDLYYDKASGKGYRFLKDSTNTYTWVIITDEDITKALALAGEKKRIFGRTPTPPYDVDDLWVYAIYPSDGSKYNKEILRCVTAKSAGENFSIDDWALASDYATNTKVAQLDYLKDALKNDTVVDGGLILSTLIALRDKSKNIQSGINGAVQDAKYKGGGIAAWYGGEMGDIEDKSNYPGVTNWAKSLLRFDGSGYLANGNVSWGPTGKVSIKDLSALINTDKTDILNVLSSISSMFSTRVKESEVLILPQLRFGELFINRLNTADTNLNNNDVVLTQGELKDRFVTIDWFNKVFSVVDANQSDLPVNGNISSGASIRAKMGLWSDGGISALGNSASSGGSGGGGLDEELLWSLLGNSGTEQISKSHLADALEGYATEEWIEGKGYLTSHQDISGKADRSELLGYLPLTGGTLTGQIKSSGEGHWSWIKDRDKAIVFGTSNGKTGYYRPVIGQKTIKGAWTIGVQDEESLVFSYTLDSNYNTNTDTSTRVLLPTREGTIITSATIGGQSVNYAATSGVANSVAWSGVTGKPTTLSGYGITDGLYSTQVSATQADITWFNSIIRTNRRAFIYNTNGEEYGYLFGMESYTPDFPRHGVILKMGYADTYLRLRRRTGNAWLTNDWEKISAGFADSADKLQTARTIWGQRFDGTNNVDGNLSCNGQGSFNSLQIGNITISYDAANKAIKINGNVYATGGISALGNSDTTGGGGGGLMGTIVPYAKAIALTTQNEGEEIASAWSVKMLYDKIETIDVSGQLTSYLTKQEARTLYLPLTGGTLSGNLNLGSNTLFAGDISIDAEEKNWNLPRKNSIKLLLCRDVPATGSPSSYMSGVSILTNYVGFQLVSYGGWKDELYFRKIEDNGVWHNWYRIYHEGFKPTKSDVGLGNVDNTADANKSVSYATTAGSANAANGVVCNLLPNAGSTVKSNKDAIVQYFNNNSGLGANVFVSSFTIRNWDDDSATVISDSVYSFIKISGGYSTSKYAQYLLSSYGEHPVGVIGRSENTWGKFHWIAYREDIPTKVSQLSNDSGYITSSGSCAYASTAGIANSVAWSNVSGRPTSMPASDVYAWAKAATKPYYTYDEIKVKSLANVADFTRVVIALCEVTKSQAYTGTFSSGEILYYRSNGVIPIEYARVNFIDSYRLNYDAYYSLETSTENESKDKPISNSYDSAGFRKCTFVYNGKHYAGVEVYFSQAASYYWRGYSHGHTVFGVIVEQNKAIKNEEIYNSLSYDGQNRSGISFGDVRADSFVKKGSSGSYVLLGNGSHALISSLSVATAAKLQTARTIWGQSFDGTSNITGPFQYESIRISNLNEIWSTGPLWLQNGARTTGDVIISHNNGGRVGIGTLSPRRKFHVEGTSYFTDEMLLESSDFKTFRISRTKVGNASLGVNSNGLYIYSNVAGVGEGEMNFKGGVGLGIDCTPQYKLHVNGDMATTGRAIVGSIVIGDITISYDKANKGLRIAGGGLYTDSYLSSLGVDASTALAVKKWADSIQITTESDAELATAYSIGNLYRLINSNQKSITQSLNQSVSALQGRCTSLEQRVSALEKKVNK